MADEVPICDVLCEAMEYLSKLGSNLRQRSDSLKEKRIRKDKLRNSHAVTKAANKVLLICQLSKKSLENVETGVKKVLDLVGISQKHSDEGGKSSTPRSTAAGSSETRPCHYFEYDRKKLRVARKISIGHFTSVKVLAKKLPKSMQDKYPVYYDCKLYRLRKKLTRAEKEEQAKKLDAKPDTDEDEKSSSAKSHVVGKKDKQEDLAKNDEVVQKLNSEREVSSKDLKSHLKSNTLESERKDIEIKDRAENENVKKKKRASIYISSESDSENISTNNTKSSEISKNGNHSQVQSKVELENEVDSPHSVDNKDSTEVKKSQSEKQLSEEDKHTGKSLKHKRLKIIDDSDSDSSEKNFNQQTVKGSDNKPQTDDENQSVTSENSSCKPLLKLVNINKLLKPDLVAEKEKANEKHKKENKSNSSESRNTNTPRKKERSKIKIYSSSESDDVSRKGKSKPRKKSYSSDSDDESRKKGKSKLTRKAAYYINSDDEIKEKGKSKSTRKKPYSSDSGDDKEKSKSTQKKAYSSDSDDEAFWEKKRKEVKAFKAKTFTINIVKLPDVSQKLLHEYNLKRITKNCITLCEIVDSTNSKKDSLNDPTPDVEIVKNALLQDSDSEKSDISKNNQCESKQNKDHCKGSSKKIEEKSKGNALQNIIADDISNSSLETANRGNDNGKLASSEEVNQESDNKKLSSDVTKEKVSNDTINNENDKIKSSLLNDSSSSDDKNNAKKRKSSVNSSSNKTQSTVDQEIQSSFLNDFSNDEAEGCVKDRSKPLMQQPSETNNSAIPENAEKSALLQDMSDDSVNSSSNNSDKITNKEKKSSPERDPNEIKSALLNDSSNEDQKSPDTSKNAKTIPQSKRKHIMESMHAKKMLLTYSSSSETEDENLNRVLKGIKEELLKGISSEEEDDIKTKCRKKLYSSHSDEDIATRAKKKRKIELKKRSVKKKSTSDDDVKSTGNSQDEASSKKSDSSKKKMGRSGDSGSSSSDTQEDKVIDGLTNLNNLNKPRRRQESSDDSEGTEKTSSSNTKRSRMAKTPLITGEGLLEAPSSSEEEAASGAESEVHDDEDLPSVTLPTINGGSIQDHLAKDDLLEESDSSKSSEEKQDDESDKEEENPKKKRRKANTISSGSEAGSSRRKDNDKDCRLSDFEDSEEDSEEPGKRSKNKRKKIKGSDSDASDGSSNDGKKKRRRIQLIDDSEGSGSESETEGRNKHGRKNIRKVMGKSQLEEATKKAAREEKERLARIAERQKMYNNVEFDETGKPDEVVVDKVILDFDPETKKPLIEVDRGLVKKLKPHQANGIKFMWDACFESVKRIKKDRGSGCILAHCMGLGKTLQVVSLTHTLLTHGDLTGVRRVLVVCPLSTVLNWVNEYRMWLQHAESDYDLDIYELSKFKQNSERAFQLSQWLEGGGVCVLGYEMFRNLSADNPKKFKKKLLKNFQESLVDPGPDLVVCDEGHLLKNEKTSLSQSMNRVRTRRRIVLTGTPLQNNLKEYYCMVQFVKPNLLGKYNEYLNRFVNPITNGQYTDSTEHDIRVMKRRSHVLHKMLDGAVQRRDYGVLAPFLPPKHEYVLFITLTDVQVKLYQHYLDNYSRRPLPGKSSGFLFPDFQSLQRIWTHPLVLKYNSERYEIMQQKKREREEEEDSEGSLVDFIDDDSTPDESSEEESLGSLSDASDDSRKKSKKKKSGKKGKKEPPRTRRGTRANPINQEEEEVKLDDDVLEVKNENPTEWWIPLVTDDELEDLRNSPKLVLLFDILRQCEAIGDKLLVFSQSLYSLDLIEHFLAKVDEATQEGRIDEKLGGHVGSWSPGVDYFRLDGSTSCENRSIWCKNFNREDNPRARLFLISTRAGGLGINLVAANRVVIFDVSWNPSHDVQSIFRVYRFGQKKPCYIYRFLAMGTMEEKIYERQVTKQAISKRVIDEQQIDRHYAENDLAELYKFEPAPPTPRPTPTLPKDRLFAEMLKDHEALIYKFHEHDSLLENKEEETLTEEERKAAWEDFENEKNRPPPVPFNAWTQHNGLMGNLVAQQQQQQLAYAALAAMLRKDMPSLSDDQIRNMLPLIYGANPAMFGGYDYGLMQKLNELYKYPQAGMMNPAMMNSMMNPSTGMGGGGTSGLQYEPPWARDMQHQNQMRLQQLMQHQNQMGAKYYAGGLGSRDPVAMALQQQRAREIMVGDRAGGAGRPRGRPPLQPRVPPAMPAAQDVVNLDSD